MHRLTVCVVTIISACQLAVSDQMLQFDRMGVLKDVLWKTFMDWPSLERAMELSKGDPPEIIDSLVHETDDFFKKSDHAGKKEIAEFLSERIENKLHTKIRDGTVEQVAGKLKTYMDVIKDPRRMDWHEFRSRILRIENKTLRHFA